MCIVHGLKEFHDSHRWNVYNRSEIRVTFVRPNHVLSSTHNYLCVIKRLKVQVAIHTKYLIRNSNIYKINTKLSCGVS